MGRILLDTPVLASHDHPNVSPAFDHLVFSCIRCLVGNPSGRSFGDVAFLEHSNLLQNIEGKMQILPFPLKILMNVSYLPQSNHHS